MTGLEFTALEANAETRAASPAIRLRFRLRAEGEPVDALALRARIQIEPALRDYAPDEIPPLEALLGEKRRGARWNAPLQWCEVSTVLGQFERELEFELVLPCTFDAQIVSSRYFAALTSGMIPVHIFFNGTIFRGSPGGFSVEMLPWNLDCAAEIPLQTWQAAMDACFPGQAWIRIDRATFDALSRVRRDYATGGWDATFEYLLSHLEEPAES